MQTETILYLIIAGIAALLLALFQYIYKSKLTTPLKYSLATLRTLSIFGLFILLINPKFRSNSFYDEKPTLVLAIDNSASIKFLNQADNTQNALEALISNSELNNRFNIDAYSFGNTVRDFDSLNFEDQQSNITQALKQFGEVYANQTAPIVILSDGNQTFGTDYSYISKRIKQPIYPLILGDSTVYSDLRISQLNVNRYVYLKNKFPVEIISNYNGTEPVDTELRIWADNVLVYKKKIAFNANKTSAISTMTLTANRVGIKTYRAELTALSNEKNTINNTKNFGVDVIDQKTNIAIVYQQLHPDLGALKKAIETNEQRKVTLIKSKDYINKINEFQLAILYQINEDFKSIFSAIGQQKLNTLIITGQATNWNILNKAQSYFEQSITNQIESFQPRLNSNYNTFIVDNLNFTDFPPLKSELGNIEFTVPHDILLTKTVNGISTDQAMLSTFEVNNTKHALLNGEGIWRWRAQSFLELERFNEFDNFIGKLVQYLSSNKRRSRINSDYKSFYNGNDTILISAQYFNKNFEFDDNAALTIIIKNTGNNRITEVPLLLDKGNYKVDLSGIASGGYDFTIKHNTESISVSGHFEVLAYNVEQQFLNADFTKLQYLANASGGEAYFSSNNDELISNLLNDIRYVTIQKSTKNIVPLIEYKNLLGFIILCLVVEWFIRKYNGLI